MDMTRRPSDDLLDVARALLLLQGAILVATTIEALVWGIVFPGIGGALLMTGASATVILVARARLVPDRRWTRRLVYLVEGLIFVAMAVDIVLALVFTHGLPPVVALLTQGALPLAVITLLRRSARITSAAIAPIEASVGGAS
jgi:hypothetical protein